MNNKLRVLVDFRDRFIQKNRIAFNNRLDAIDRGSDETDPSYRRILMNWSERLDQLEIYLNEDIERVAQEEEIINVMTSVKGVGRLLAAKVAAMIEIEKSPTISALWRYAGYGLKNGERDRPVRGQKLVYNKRLKTTCYVVGMSFLKTNAPYRRIYDEAREYYQANHPDWTKMHCHRAAMRKMIKLWLSHLWIVWRKMEGLPISDPYIIASDKKHTHLITPEEMGWKLDE